MIIETSDNRFYRVTECREPELAHLWHGFRVKKSRGKWVEAAKAQLTYIRRPPPASWSSDMADLHTPDPDIVVVFDDVAAFWDSSSAWQATVGDYDLDCTVGRGRTPLDAIVDLLDQIEG